VNGEGLAKPTFYSKNLASFNSDLTLPISARIESRIASTTINRWLRD